MAAEHDYQLKIIRQAIDELPGDDRFQVQGAAQKIREIVSDYGDNGLVAFALVGSEIAAAEDD
jgi:hypothetical protein